MRGQRRCDGLNHMCDVQPRMANTRIATTGATKDLWNGRATARSKRFPREKNARPTMAATTVKKLNRKWNAPSLKMLATRPVSDTAPI